MPIKTLDLSPANTGRPFAVLIAQPAASALTADVILRARMTARFGVVLAETFVEIARETIPAPATANGVGRRWVAIGGVPGASAYQAECNAADLEDIQIQAGPYVELDAAALWLEHTAQASPGGTSTSIEVSISPASAGVLSVGVEQDDASTEPVLVVIEASDPTSPTGYTEVGRRRFDAPAPGPGRRLVAFAAIPGALSYRVTATSLDGARPYAQMGPFFDLQAPLEWIVDGRPIPGPSPFGQSAETVTYVATNGSDATGERGNVLRPFATIQAAVSACQDDDTIFVAPGDYAPFVVPPTRSLTIAGQGAPGQVRIAAAVPGCVWAPDDAQPRRLVLENLWIENSLPGPAVFVAGSGLVPNQHQLILIRSVCFSAGGTPAVSCFNLARVDAILGAATFGIVDCNGSNLQDMFFAEAFYNTASPTPAHVTLEPHLIRGGFCQTVSVTGGQITAADAGTVVESLFLGGIGVPMGPETIVRFYGRASIIILSFDGLFQPLSAIDFRGANLENFTSFHDISGSGDHQINAQGAKIFEYLGNQSGTDQVILDTSGGNIQQLSSSAFVGNIAWRRLSMGARLNVPPGGSTYLYQADGGDLPGAKFPAVDLVSYNLTATNPGDSLTVGPLTAADVLDLFLTSVLPQDVYVSANMIQ